MPATQNTPSRALNDKKVINGWAIFDWANSAFALVITVAIFPAYFEGVTDDLISIGRLEISNSTYYAYAISLSYLIIALLSPLLSGIADYGGKKKFFLKLFTTAGAFGCLSLFFFQNMSQLAVGTAGFVLAMIGFAGGLVFYNSYLPEIVTEDQYDRVSARGFAFGYVGSVLLLLINLAVILGHEQLGLSESFATRLAFVMVGLWWLGFAQVSFRRLPHDPVGRPQARLVTKGLAELKKVWRAVRPQYNIKSFLFSFFCYSAGVQTVLFLAATFASKELQMDQAELIAIILLLQVVAIGGAYLFAKISDWRGNKFSLITMLLIWLAICIFAYFVFEKWQFYFVAAGVDLVMGGIQSLSRSTYSKLLPVNTKDTTSFFSFYDVLEKVAIILGTFSFGFIEQLTGSMRISVLVLGGFFVISLIILLTVKIEPMPAAPETAITA